MRWTIYFLIVLNVLVFTWFKFQENYNNETINAHKTSHDFDFSRVEALQVAEMSESEVGGDKPVVADVLVQKNVQKDEAEKDRCWLLGYFPEVISARDMRITLENIGVYTHIVAKERELPAVSWVYIPPLESRQDAMALLKELQSNNIDSFVVMDEGEDQFAISLGFFGNKDSALMVMKQRLAEGYSAKIAERIRKRPAFWLGLYEIQHSDKELMNIRLENALKQTERVKRQEISCKELALLETKH